MTREFPRREFLRGVAGAVAAIAVGGCAPATMPAAQGKTMLAYVGGYTAKERNGRGEGVSVYRIDPASGTWTQVQLLKDIVNPSWLTLDRQQRVLYSAHGDGTEAIAYASGKNGVRLGSTATVPEL